MDQTVGLAFAIYVIVILGHDHQLKKRIEGRWTSPQKIKLYESRGNNEIIKSIIFPLKCIVISFWKKSQEGGEQPSIICYGENCALYCHQYLKNSARLPGGRCGGGGGGRCGAQASHCSRVINCDPLAKMHPRECYSAGTMGEWQKISGILFSILHSIYRYS